MPFDVEAAGQSYVSGMGRTDKYIRKLRANTKHPGQRANKQLAKATANYSAAAAPGGKMEVGNRSYDVTAFNNAAIANAGRLAEGARKGLQAWKDAMNKQMSARDAAMQAIDQMREQDASPKDRVGAWIDAMQRMAGKI